MKVILSLDIGSSSIRCSAQRLTLNDDDGSKKDDSYAGSRPVMTVTSLSETSSSTKVSSVRPTTGHVILKHEDSSTTGTLLDIIDTCMDNTLALLRQHYGKNKTSTSTYQVVGIGVSSFVMNLIGLDKSGTPVGEDATLSYACNTPHVVEECKVLKSDLGTTKLEELYQLTGAPIHTAYALPQLRSYYKTKASPASSAASALDTKDCARVNVKQWSSIASICVSRWTGMEPSLVPISYSEASWTGMLNFRSCKWENECMKLLSSECQEALPTVADYMSKEYSIDKYCACTTTNSSSKRVRNSYWDRWPELRGGTNDNGSSTGCRIFLGVGDGACANIGSKCTSLSRIAVTIGTSAAIRVCMPLPCCPDDDVDEPNDTSSMVDKFTVPRGLFCYRINESYVLVGGALTDGGSIIEWLRNLMNLTCDANFDSCLQKASLSYHVSGSKEEACNATSKRTNQRTDTTTLSVIPFLGGERSIGFRGGASGSIIGLSRNTSSSDLMRACLESVVLRLNSILMAMNITEPMSCIVASGNALERNQLWRQMLADCTQKPVIIDDSTNEGTSRGVGILVGMESLKALGGDEHTIALVEEKLQVSDEQSPDNERKAHWSTLQTLQDDNIQCIAPMWNR